MPVLVFFSAVIQLLYYFGAVQYVILKIAWLVNTLMDTSPVESISTIASVFVGMVGKRFKVSFNHHGLYYFRLIFKVWSPIAYWTIFGVIDKFRIICSNGWWLCYSLLMIFFMRTKNKVNNSNWPKFICLRWADRI